MKDGEAGDTERVRVVVREGGGHTWESVEASCEEHERGRTGSRGRSAVGEDLDAAFGEGFVDDLSCGLVLERGIDEF